MKSTKRSAAITRRVATALVASAMLGASLVACSSSPSSSSSASDVDAALKKGGTITYWSWTPSAEAQVAAFEKAYPKVHGQARQRRNEHHRVHEAAERGQGRLRCARRRAGRVLRHLAVRARQGARRPQAVRLRLAEERLHAGSVERRERRRPARRAAAGLRPHGAVLQQGRLRQVRADRAEDMGRVRRRREEAARGRPDRSTSPATRATPASRPA